MFCCNFICLLFLFKTVFFSRISGKRNLISDRISKKVGYPVNPTMGNRHHNSGYKYGLQEAEAGLEGRAGRNQEENRGPT